MSEEQEWHPGLCFHCGEAQRETRDHVIPKGWFLKPRPSNLPTVPSCRPCNESFQKDETLVRAYLVAYHTTNPAARKLFEEKVIRDFQRPEGRPLLKRIVRSTLLVEVRTSSGLILGTAIATQTERERVERVIEKIIRGLYYREIGERLSNDIPVEILDVSEIDNTEELKQIPAWGSFGDVVRYKFGQVPDRPTRTIWYIQFFEGVTLQCCTDCDETS